MKTPTDKDALKQLRETRRFTIERSRKMIKEQSAVIKAIMDRIGPDGATVPQIAADLSMDSAKVLLFVSGLRNYGLLTEGPKDGDYFIYQKAQP
jgi:DNA-binding IclR family transcriptional regulator